MDFEIKLPNEDDLQRKAYRTKVPGFNAFFEATQGKYSIKDLSATGFAIEDESKSFEEGKEYAVELRLKEKTFLGGITVQAMRVLSNGIVGFNFANLDRRQQLKLDKLVLEVQKRLIALKKAKRQQDADDQAK